MYARSQDGQPGGPLGLKLGCHLTEQWQSLTGRAATTSCCEWSECTTGVMILSTVMVCGIFERTKAARFGFLAGLHFAAAPSQFTVLPPPKLDSRLAAGCQHFRRTCGSFMEPFRSREAVVGPMRHHAVLQSAAKPPCSTWALHHEYLQRWCSIVAVSAQT